RPALLGLLLTQGQLLPVADRRQAPAGESLTGEVVLHRLRAPGTESQIVLDGAPVVAMAFQLGLRLRIVTQPLEVLIEGPACRLVEVVTVVVEVHVLQGAALRRPEALPRPIQAAATDAFLVDAALGRLGVLRRGWDLRSGGRPRRERSRHRAPASSPTSSSTSSCARSWPHSDRDDHAGDVSSPPPVVNSFCVRPSRSASQSVRRPLRDDENTR